LEGGAGARRPSRALTATFGVDDVLRSHFLSFVAVLALVAGQAHAADISPSANVQVVNPINVTKTSDLSFGAFVAGPGLGSDDDDWIDIQPSGVVSYSDSAKFLTVPSRAPSPAKFTISGSPGFVVSVSVSSSRDIPLGPSLKLQSLNLPQASGQSFTIGNSGVETYALGGRLRVTGPLAQGKFSTQFTITVNYQ